jgi:hypothetical protein
MEKTLQKDVNLHNYLKEHIEIIINNLLKNLDKIQEKQSITIIGKMLRKIIKGKDYLKYILNIKIFGNLVSLARSKNLFLSKEIFNIIFYIIESKKIDQNEVKIFINSQAKNFCEIVINHLKYLNNLNELENDDDDNKCYFMKRESLVFVDKILKNYEKFNSLFTNNIEALKGIMIIINSNYNEVMIVGITILNYFFVDIEEKENKIKKILYVNKENFENFFKKNADVKEIEEQKFFILYELERLGNILFDDENKENNKDNNNNKENNSIDSNKNSFDFIIDNLKNN